MRGRPERQARMLYGETPDDLIPASHPLRRIRDIVERCLSRLDGDLTLLYAVKGRPSAFRLSLVSLVHSAGTPTQSHSPDRPVLGPE